MKAAMIQMRVLPDKEQNLTAAVAYIEKAAAAGADIAVLPEMFNCPYDNAFFADYSEPAQGHTCEVISCAAAKNNIIVVGGSIPESDSGRLYNTSFVFGNKGEMLARHRKAHLFDIDVPGGQRFFESETFTRGDDVTVFDTPLGKIGLCICFDIRFPELVRCMALRGAKVVIVPAAFNMTTGPAHWEAIFKMRAVDNQLFTMGVSPARDKSASYVAYGNSIVCDPWGDVICRAGEGEQLMIAQLDMKRVDEIRGQLPLIASLRGKLYRDDYEMMP